MRTGFDWENKGSKTIDFVFALLREMPSSAYSPIVLVDQTGSVFNKIVREYFAKNRKQCYAVELSEIIDINDLDTQQWLLERKPILIICNIEKFGTGAKWQRKFFDLFNFTYNANMNIIITSSIPIQELSVEGRIYARLSWGIQIELEPEDIRMVEENEAF